MSVPYLGENKIFYVITYHGIPGHMKGANTMKPELVEIRFPKHTIFLTKGEILTLLKHDMSIWERDVKRGKHERRARQTAQRKPKAVSQE
jgi:hypothetical protein